MSQLANLLGSVLHKEAVPVRDFFRALQSVSKGSKGVYEIAKGTTKANPFTKFFHTGTTSQFADVLKRNPNALVKANGSHYKLSDIHKAIKSGGKVNENIFSKLTAVGDAAVAAAGADLKPVTEKAVESATKQVPGATATTEKVLDTTAKNLPESVKPADLKRAQELTNASIGRLDPVGNRIEGTPLRGQRLEEFMNKAKQKFTFTKPNAKPKTQVNQPAKTQPAKNEIATTEPVKSKGEPVVPKKEPVKANESSSSSGSEKLPEGYDALDGRPANNNPVNWTDRFRTNWEKDPVKTVALTGGGLYAGNKIIDSLFD